eukprot:6322588-Pyramimonas_sp.AAC.1
MLPPPPWRQFAELLASFLADHSPPYSKDNSVIHDQRRRYMPAGDLSPFFSDTMSNSTQKYKY